MEREENWVMVGVKIAIGMFIVLPILIFLLFVFILTLSA